ncbi:MAG: LD-carboxypeptidase [Planctomycetota bacterium]
MHRPPTPIRPPMLIRGDLVAVVAPSASPNVHDKLQRGVRFLEEQGLRVRVGVSVLRERTYIGRDRDLRADDLNRQLRDKKVRGVFCLVGGFSAYEILEKIDYAAIARDPKVVMGFSDNTSILNAIHTRTGVVTFMGENVLWGLSERRRGSRERFLRALMDPRPLGKVEDELEAWRDAPVRRARTVAGNLSTITALTGSLFAPAYRGRILFWEDIGIGADDANAALWQLRLTGVLARLRGMVIGHLEGLDEENSDITIRHVVLTAADRSQWPIYKTGAFGHWRPSLVIPIGIRASIGRGEIAFEESGVSSR